MVRASVTLKKREREREREREAKSGISPYLPVGSEGRVATSRRDHQTQLAFSLPLLSPLSLLEKRTVLTHCCTDFTQF